MKKKKISATFPDGAKLRRTTTRYSDQRGYTHAWRVCWVRPLNAAGKPVDTRGTVHAMREASDSGFASSYERAAQAAKTVVNRIGGYPGYEITKHDIVAIDEAPQ